MNMRVTTKMIGAAFAAASLMASATAAHADLKCRQTVAKESAKLTQAIAKALLKCEQGVIDGKVTGPCPDTAKAAPAITKAESKLQAAVNKKCTTSTGEFAFGRCPNETGTSGSCTGILIQGKDDVGQCLSCLAEHNATELVHRVLFGSLIPSTDKVIGKCRKAVGKATVGFYNAKSKALAKCHDGFLKGKIPSCPDVATTDVIAKAESKKVASISKDCCGADKTCGGATCQAGAPATALGDPCEADSDCGRCSGGTTDGQPCRGSGQCQSDPGSCNPGTLHCIGGTHDGQVCALTCTAGPNAGASCTTNSQCPSSTCGDCPSVAGGTCVGTSGFCGGVDDLSPAHDVGYPMPCPGITSGGSPIVLTGETGASLLTCVDTQADQRIDCQDAAGATFLLALPPSCVDSVAECQSNAGTATVTVAITTPVSLGGITISLGYNSIVMIPGTGDVSSRVTNIQTGLIVANDTNDSVITSIVDFTGLVQGPLYTVQFDTCGSLPAISDFGCVVSSASDVNGVELLDGVSCSVTSIL
jgi:hypothetical protein